MDFQNAGKIVFNNEEYNVLKLTVHTITDYFQESILRREIPKERLFVDKNGFRHSWTGTENKPDLRERVSPNHIDNFLDDSKDLIATSNARNADSLPTKDAVVSYVNKGTKDEEEITKSDTAKTGNADLRKAGKQHKKLLRSCKKTRRPWQQPPPGTTSVTTKYFCPYFGVLTMVSFVNNSIVQSWKPTMKTTPTIKTTLTTKPKKPK